MALILARAGSLTTLVSIELLLRVLLGLVRDIWVPEGAALCQSTSFCGNMRRTLCIPSLHSRGRGLRWALGFGFVLGAWLKILLVDV
jgi:hypothetical protein